MEWTDSHDVILAKEVRVCEPWRFKSRTVERGKVWATITQHLNDVEERGVKFSVSKKSVQEHFKLVLDKFKAKRKREEKLSGVNTEDTELDTLLEEINEKWEEAEASDLYVTNKQKADADRAIGEEIRKKAVEKLGETSKRKAAESEPAPKKSRRNSNETLDFLREKMASRQTEAERQAKIQQEMITMMQNQNNAILQILQKMADK